ncbi:MAG: isocitrate dehydrogenase kinase/phosphatase, partial [Limisphaerales bacterium]
LIGRKEIRQLFDKFHGDLFDIRFWKLMQSKIRDGQILTVFPYRMHRRFEPKRSLLPHS